MATMKYKPTTPSRRHMSVASFDEVTKFTPEKSLIETKKKHSGRNNYGKITVRHHGGGNKQKYRLIDFKRENGNATVIGVEYDPNRTSYIALLENEEGKKSYVLAPYGVTDGDVLTITILLGSFIASFTFSYSYTSVMLEVGQTLAHCPQFMHIALSPV